MEQIKKFTIDFFKNLKCDLRRGEGDVLVVENVPSSFEDLVGRVGPYRLAFVAGVEGAEFVGKSSLMLETMRKFLKGAGKTTLLRIDFDCDPEVEVRKRLSLRNCEIDSLKKSCRNSFFSRFSFVTSFNYLNESERVASEVYVHEGAIVEGNLGGYKVVDGDVLKVDSEKVKEDYEIARRRSVELDSEKRDEIAGVLKGRVEDEIARIREYYDIQLKEFGGDLNERLERVRAVELELRSCAEDESDVLRKRLERLRGSLVKAGSDEIVGRVLKEREMTIQDVMQKFSLNVDRKLLNMTVIYYPRYIFRLCLKSDVGESVERFIEVSYDPLTKSLGKLKCEGCGSEIRNLSLCSGGHISCGDCLDSCGECGRRFCARCLKRDCGVCGRKLCKDCVKMCLRCGGSVCSTHMRTDCVSGEERCVSCLRVCFRCHGMAEEKHFGEASDGSKVCEKCLGAERREKVLKNFNFK